MSMGDYLTKHIPPLAASGEYHCPVDECGAIFAVNEPTVSLVGDRLTVQCLPVSALEDVLRAHMNDHSVEAFLRTIHARDLRIAELERAFDQALDDAREADERMW